MTVTGIVTAVIVGAIIGALGRLFAPGKSHISVPATIGVGVVAALLGTAIASSLSLANTAGVDWIELALQVGLATIGVGMVARRSRGRSR